MWIWLLVVVVVVFAVWARPARVVVALEGGDARVVRGRLPGAVVEDLRIVASLTPGVSGRVELRGSGDGLDIRTPGLDEGVAQRVRNALHLRRRDV